MKKYKLVVSGGTFDRFHKGHERFLLYQLEISDAIVLGITSDTFARRKDQEIEPFEVRQQSVKEFLIKNNALSRVKYVAIESGGIPEEFAALPIEAIVVTEATQNGAEYVNNERVKQGIEPLIVEVVALVKAEDGKPISSTRIRTGAISREGTVYLAKELMTHTFSLPEAMRSSFKEPFGTLIKNNAFDFASLPLENVITVGDVATKTFLERNLHQRMAVVDFVVERQKQYDHPKDIGFSGHEQIIRAENPAGSITPSLFSAINQAFAAAGTVVITVSGEEDLAVLPVILAAPLGYEIFYGQPGEGLVRVKVTEEKKALAFSLIHKLKKDEN